jgi:hypothetical protein
MPMGNRWAVIVGGSGYADARLSLRYAHRDAEKLYTDSVVAPVRPPTMPSNRWGDWRALLA